MTSYQMLDFIADLYISLLFLLIMIESISTYSSDNNNDIVKLTIYLLAALSVAFGMYLINSVFGIYKLLSLDYCTHTAFGLSMALVYLQATTSQKMKNILYGSFISYFLVMVFQLCHTVVDITVTIINIVPIMYVIHRMIFNKHVKQQEIALKS